jgi:hypothetical protein
MQALAAAFDLAKVEEALAKPPRGADKKDKE